jgi:phosphoribosyl-ATP pyrophosphohydrolase
LDSLGRLIDARLASPGDSSGTNRLMTESGLLDAKLREEADELARAATRAEVVHEAADLLYFTMAALARAGATLADVEAELALRRLKVSRRPMVARQ